LIITALFREAQFKDELVWPCVDYLYKTGHFIKVQTPDGPSVLRKKLDAFY